MNFYSTRISSQVTIIIYPDPCEAGKYGPEGALTCEVCPLNKFSSQAGSAQCSDCPLGKVSNTGSTYCGEKLFCSVFFSKSPSSVTCFYINKVKQ